MGRISTSKKIPCNCSENCPQKFSYEMLLKAEKNNIETVQCLNSFKSVQISLLLDGYKRKDGYADSHRDFEAFVSAKGETSKRSFQEWAGAERVTLAIAFTDIIGSTTLGEVLDKDVMNEARWAHFAQSRTLIREFNGFNVKTIGDSFLAVFKSADKALDYAMALHRNTGHPKIQIRVGIHVGPMNVEEEDIFGSTVGLAAHIVRNIKSAEIWLSDRAKEDIDNLGALKYKSLTWQRHDEIKIKGYPSVFTLWSLNESPSYNTTVVGLKEQLEDEKLDRTALEASTGLPALAIRRVVLENIRGFQKLDLQLSNHESPDRFVLVLGNNAAGKTTLLRAIASTFCDEANAAALANPATLLRAGAKKGYIRVEFGPQPKAVRNDNASLWVENQLFRVSDSEVKLEQKISLELSRKRLFIAGYGPSRLSFGREQEVEYSARAAVMTLFEREASLTHPELVLRRIESTGTPWEDISKQIDEILQLQPGSVRLEKGGGLSIMSPHSSGEQFPFTDVGDGYLSTLSWILDLCGSWMLFAKNMPIGSISGVVLIDELEQHLHPTWQREIVKLLHKQFPNLQFIAATHSALCALGTTAIPNESQLVLLQGKEGTLEALPSDPPEAQNVNQILTSPLFGLFSASSFGVIADIKRYADLKSMQERTPNQESELNILQKRLDDILGPFENEFHRKLERVIHEVAEKELAREIEKFGFDSEALNFEIRARLREILFLEVPK